MRWLLFFTSGFLIFYHYLLYPAVLILLARRRAANAPAPTSENDAGLPTVTLLIAAYNEARVIEDKLRNSLALDYPRAKLEIMVVSDGSTDTTPEIVASFASQGVRSLFESPRRGKTAALNRGVAAASGEIVIFSDANNDFDKNAIRLLVRHFQDVTVGGVSGSKKIYADSGRESTVGDSLYWRYESALKLAESRLGSITAADGEIFAIRHKLFQPIDPALINDDAAITINLVQSGYRVLYEPDAHSYEHASINIEDDFHVKVRMVAGGFQTLFHYWRFLLLPRRGFAFAFLSHKLLRWLMPLLLMAFAVASLSLYERRLGELAIAAQLLFYGLAVAGWRQRRRGALPNYLYVPFYFCTMNLAALLGLLRFLNGRQTTLWRKAQR